MSTQTGINWIQSRKEIILIFYYQYSLASALDVNLLFEGGETQNPNKEV